MSGKVTKRMSALYEDIKSSVENMDGCDHFEDMLPNIKYVERKLSTLKSLINMSVKAEETGNPLIRAPHINGVYGSPSHMIWVNSGRVVNGQWDVTIPVDGDGSVVYSPFDKDLENPIPYLCSTSDVTLTDIPGSDEYDDIGRWDYGVFLSKARKLFDLGLLEPAKPGDHPPLVEVVFEEPEEYWDDIPF